MVPARSVAAFAALVAAAPAMAQERLIPFDLPAGPAEETIRALGRQARVSIGFRDRKLARVSVSALRGRFTPSQALARLFAGTPARARRVAPDSFVVERAPLQRIAVPLVASPLREAAPPPTVVADDIVVTATKRAVPLRDFAGSAQIIEGNSLSPADATHGTGLIETRAASVSSTHLGQGRNKLFIRGIADSSFVGPTQATVGQYWSNSRLTYSAPDPSLRLYDIKAIEVLEGPQGTLYGAGSLGGIVRVLPNAPDLHTSAGQAWGGIQAVWHGAPSWDGGVVANVPIVPDKLAIRALAYGGIDGGYIDDRLRKLRDVNRVDTYGGRLALRYVPGDDWTIDATALVQRIDGKDSQYADLQGNRLSRANAVAQPFRNDYALGELVLRKTWGSIESTSSIAHARQRVFERFEGPSFANPSRPEVGPGPDLPASTYSQDDDIGMTSAETRLARRSSDGTGWLAGVSVLHNQSQIRRRMNTVDRRMSLTGVRNSVDEQTLYGEYALSPVRRVILSLGARVSRAALDGKSQDVARDVALSRDPRADSDRTETRFLPAGSLAWRVDEDITLYARYQESFRPGGVAVRQQYVQRFNDDRVRSVEGGLRIVRPSFEAGFSVSYNQWRDIQADIIDGLGFPTTANIGDGRIWSIGWSGRLRPAAGLEFDAALYLNDSRLTQPDFSILPIDIGPIGQNQLPNVAHGSGRVGFTYSGRLDDRFAFDLTGYARYTGKSTLGIGSILGHLQGNYVDTGLALRVGDGRRGISLTVTNLLDVRGNRFSLGSPFLIREQEQLTPLQPRSLRLGLDLAF